jgi:hypothetical protein
LAEEAMKLATGDDDGAVKLFKFPCLEKNVIVGVNNYNWDLINMLVLVNSEIREIRNFNFKNF